ncbi:MAG: hypothetical protein A2235_00900 [Deltaproteobacteria bacterium RIFOXYA2_FULL_42_10]|nr:MAG: hypothetical protein A2235_00900 [Deltaproteobacteria bacterium RIFOXYA2_FULL_42_10]
MERHRWDKGLRPLYPRQSAGKETIVLAPQDRYSLKKIIHIIDVCLRDIDYLTALYSIFGITTDEISGHLSLRESMLEWRNKLQRINMIEKGHGTWKGFDSTKAEALFPAHLQVYETVRELKEQWNSGPPKVLCSEKALLDLASKIRKEGSALLYKNDIAKFFDFSEVFTLWHQVPDYTLFVIGSGIFLSSPEFDLFDAMGWFHDEAVRTRQELLQYKEKDGTSEFKEEVYSKLFAIHHINCRQRSKRKSKRGQIFQFDKVKGGKRRYMNCQNKRFDPKTPDPKTPTQLPCIWNIFECQLLGFCCWFNTELFMEDLREIHIK